MSANDHRSLPGQLKERHIWRVLIAYPSLAFVLLQAIEFFINNYGLDHRVLTAGIIVSAVLFPAAFLWNWRHGEAGRQAFTRSEVGAYAVSLAAAVAAVAWYFTATPPRSPTPETRAQAVRSIAVLPFENAGEDAESQYLCDGIAESLINWLTGVPGVRVVSKTASFRMRDQAHDLAGLAEALKADSILRGRLERVGDQVLVSAALVDTRDDSQLWGERFTQPVGEVLRLEQSIVTALTSSLRLRVEDKQAAPPAGGTEDPQAYQHYLRGHHLIQSTNSESIDRGLEELRAAIRSDPGFARPYADLADALTQFIYYGQLEGQELLGEARNAAYTAVALAPGLAESHTALANILLYFEMDWAAADEAFEAAIALKPQSPVPYHRYADYLSFTLRFERAREMALAALNVDPLDSSSMHALGLVELFAGHFTAAANAFGAWNQYHPGSRWSYTKHAVALALDGQCDAALGQADAVMNMSGGQVSILMESWLAWAYRVCGEAGRYAASRAHIEAALAADPGGLDPGYFYLWALEGDAGRIVDTYAAMVETRNPTVFFGQIFLLDHFGWGIGNALSEDPRFLALLDQIGFPPRDGS